tara:strand:+ start:1097 stop:2482 length:1386 start_codon:yes stop_codon:yes gene_type:complete
MSDNASARLPFLILGPVLGAVAFGALQMTGWDTKACWTGAIAATTVVWWITEPIPIPAASLLPLGAFPVTGVLSAGQVASAYGSQLVLLLLGGFILSTAMEASGAHRRVALSMVNLVGGHSSRRIVFGFMAASALLSMWISNTATTLMLLPVALAVIERSKDPELPIPLLLGVAYAASVGGIGTPIGTPPNVVFMQVYRDTTGTDVDFVTWMTWAIPVVVVFVPIVWLWMTRRLTYEGQVEMPDVGKWDPYEKRVLIVFALTALAWVTRKQPFGGWSGQLEGTLANDASVALLAVVVMFLVPNGHGGKLLDWDRASTIPWGMLILFGGGIAIATAFVSSGLSAALGEALSSLAGLPALLMIAVICLTITFLTEVTSNTATTTLLMPILAAAAIAAAIDPRLLMVPAAMSASCAFMLPVATAPNTIMFSTGRFPTRVMAREGFVLNLVGAVIISILCYLLVS